MKKVYVDLDGVLADFESGIKDIYNLDLKSLNKEQLDNLKKEFSKDEFFLKLKPYPNAASFIKQLKTLSSVDVEILTSVSEFDSENIAKQKEEWVRNFIDDSIKFNWVPKSKDKKAFADKNSILIDDRENAYIPFKNAGGKIIPHKNFKKSLEELIKSII